MIYQCYFKKEHTSRLFPGPLYRGFGLEPGVNSTLLNNCPELNDPRVRLQLTEYAAFLWHWRNEANPDDWIGFTSYRQLDKSRKVFQSQQEIGSLLEENAVIGWCKFRMVNRSGDEISLYRHTEFCHPQLNNYLEKTLEQFGHVLPASWRTLSTGFFANYWIMKNQQFDDFMRFSWPMVEWSLGNIADSGYYHHQPLIPRLGNTKATGYFMERLFIIWYLLQDLEPMNVGRQLDFIHDF